MLLLSPSYLNLPADNGEPGEFLPFDPPPTGLFLGEVPPETRRTIILPFVFPPNVCLPHEKNIKCLLTNKDSEEKDFLLAGQAKQQAFWSIHTQKKLLKKQKLFRERGLC